MVNVMARNFNRQSYNLYHMPFTFLCKGRGTKLGKATVLFPWTKSFSPLSSLPPLYARSHIFKAGLILG